MPRIYDAITAFFKQDKWPFDVVNEQEAIRVEFAGDHGRWICYAEAHEAQGLFAFYSVLSAKAPKEKRILVAEFITRANYSMIIGNFEMDYDDGEVRYKTSIDVKGDELRAALIQQVVYGNVKTVDLYFEGLMSVIYGGATPAAAIAKIESSG